MMGLNDNHFIENDATIAGFDGTSSKPACQVFLNVVLAGKVVCTKLFLIDPTTPQNAFLGRPCTHHMGVVVSTLH